VPEKKQGLYKGHHNPRNKNTNTEVQPRQLLPKRETII